MFRNAWDVIVFMGLIIFVVTIATLFTSTEKKLHIMKMKNRQLTARNEYLVKRLSERRDWEPEILKRRITTKEKHIKSLERELEYTRTLYKYYESILETK